MGAGGSDGGGGMTDTNQQSSPVDVVRVLTAWLEYESRESVDDAEYRRWWGYDPRNDVQSLIEQIKAEEARAEAFYQDYDQAQDRLVRTQEQLETFRDVIDNELARHLCYTGEGNRAIFWREVDHRLADRERAGSNPARES